MFEEAYCEPLTPEELKVLYPEVQIDDRALKHFVDTDGRLFRYSAPNRNYDSYLESWNEALKQWTISFTMLKTRSQ